MVARLLDKDPATRLGWAELPGHPFWKVVPACIQGWSLPDKQQSHLCVYLRLLLRAGPIASSGDAGGPLPG